MFLKYWHTEKLGEQLQKAQEAVITIQKGNVFGLLCQYFSRNFNPVEGMVIKLLREQVKIAHP